MKLNIVRAWKDEVYRQSLSNEQIGMLPANPAGEVELTDTSLQFIYGTGGGFGAGGGGGVAPSVTHGVFHSHEVGNIGVGAAGSSSSRASEFQESFHSLAFRCNETAFSITATSGFNILSPVNAFCINDED